MVTEQNQSDIKHISVSRYTITAALPYTNGPVHIGHLARSEERRVGKEC